MLFLKMYLTDGGQTLRYIEAVHYLKLFDDLSYACLLDGCGLIYILFWITQVEPGN